VGLRAVKSGFISKPRLLQEPHLPATQRAVE
jgi:hypothetical protein